MKASAIDLVAADSPQEALQSLERRLKMMDENVFIRLAGGSEPGT